MQKTNLISPHGGYRKLKSYQTAEIIYDLTVEFCRKYISPIGDRTNRSKESIGPIRPIKHKTYRTNRSFKLQEQMTGAARSGKQNIAEGCQVSGTSKKSELKLISIARGSLEELLQDFEDFLRQHNLLLWAKDSAQARAVRGLAYKSNRSYKTYRTYMSSPEGAANTAICLIHQANYLLDRQLQSLEKQFLEQGGFTEKLYKKRTEHRANKNRTNRTREE